MIFKEIDAARCPWCGEIYFESGETCANRTMKLCGNCNRRIIQSFAYNNREYIIIFMIAFFLFLANVFIPVLYDHVVGIYLIPPAIYFLMNKRKFPLWRAGGLKEEEILGYADIHWYSVKNGGIGLPRLRLIDNMIFPVCFVDERGNPVSQTVCVRLHKSFSVFWKNVRVQLISEDLWKSDDAGRDPWEKAVKFVVFNKSKKIGEGKLKELDSITEIVP